jgi:predicted glycosyltransferase
MRDGRRPPLLLYCQHSLGLGHLRRSWTLAAALTHDFDVVILSGGAPVAGLLPPEGIRLIQLPPLAQEVDGGLVSLNPGMSVAQALFLREQLVLQVFRSLDPAVVLIELFPFGRKKFARELMTLLDATRRPSRPVVACSVRDILVGRGAAQQEHDERARAIAEEYFDAVLVHADPAFARFEETFKPWAPLQVPVYYTGFVVPRRGEPTAPAVERRVLVSAGGGRYGGALFETAIAAFPALRHRLGCTLTIVAGPLCPEATWDTLQAAAGQLPSVTLCRTVPDLFPLMTASTVSVSQCGYNTALELAQAHVPAVVVPFDAGGEDEQVNRARRLERLGLARMLEAAHLTTATLVDAVGDAASRPPRVMTLDLQGADKSASLLAALLAGGARPAHAVIGDVVQE